MSILFEYFPIPVYGTAYKLPLHSTDLLPVKKCTIGTCHEVKLDSQLQLTFSYYQGYGSLVHIFCVG